MQIVKLKFECQGIVGAGISGCSVAYFLKETFGDKVDLVVFESSDIIGTN